MPALPKIIRFADLPKHKLGDNLPMLHLTRAEFKALWAGVVELSQPPRGPRIHFVPHRDGFVGFFACSCPKGEVGTPFFSGGILKCHCGKLDTDGQVGGGAVTSPPGCTITRAPNTPHLICVGTCSRGHCRAGGYKYPDGRVEFACFCAPGVKPAHV